MNYLGKKRVVSGAISLLILCALIIISYSVFGTGNFGNLTLSALLYKIGRFSALIGFLLISILIISGDLARLFDRFFGIDRIIKTQRRVAIFTYFVVFSHPLFIVLSQRRVFDYVIPDFSLLPLSFGIVSLYLFAGIMLSSLLYKRISYNSWQYIHIVTYVLFFMVGYHAIYWGSSYSLLPVKIVYWSLCALVLVGAIYRTGYKIKQRGNKFVVVGVKNETHDSFTLTIEPAKPIDFKPGQFFFLRINGKRLYARHPFSVSSSPNEGQIQFTVKLAGRFTQEAMKLKKGDEIKVEGPFGNFVFDDNRDNVFIAGGVGITPFMSWIRGKREDKSKQRGSNMLIYASRTERDIIFKKEIDSLKGNWLRVVYILSREDKSGEGYEFGRINEEMLKKHIKSIKGKVFYICGPEEMTASVYKTLRELGVKRGEIIYEDFFW